MKESVYSFFNAKIDNIRFELIVMEIDSIAGHVCGKMK